ncbi:MAG TPA: alpha/beta fold hydrolase [Gemmataceae bacterium]|nr:alpha/beta fold hydrolase [Gemmataceae bacterium]
MITKCDDYSGFMDETTLLPGPPPTVVRHKYATVNGVRLHYAEALPAEADPNRTANVPLCLALHGFPEFWYAWRHQLPALAAAGFRAIAPDLRGYNLSGKPRGVTRYGVAHLVADAAGLVRATGHPRAAVVGHDWGGAVAWALAMRHPELVERLVVLNAPHPAAYLRELRTPSQLLRSWYVFFFQLPGLPEWFLRRHEFAFLDRALRRQVVRPGAFTDEDVRLYKEALGRPGALTAALNYYRALFRGGLRRAREQVRPVTAPTLLLWGEQDRYLTPRLTEGLEPWVPDLRVERFADASHWLHAEWPERVNRLTVEFLRGETGGRGTEAPRPR